MSLNLTFAAGKKGDRIESLDTPCLLLDLDVFERNLSRLEQSITGKKVRLRPHAKSHKCPEIARRQIARGAVGICCQKVSEAQAFVEAGITDVLISNEVVGEKKIARLIDLAARATISVCVDDAANASDMSQAAAKAGVTIGVLIEMDVGAKRCGVTSIDGALTLAKHIASLPGLKLLGLQAYHGPAQHYRTPSERESAIAKASELARSAAELLKSNGLTCQVITGAGTGSYVCEANSGVFNEIQPGSYIFMDADYAKNQTAPKGEPLFEHSLFVLSSVMSATRPGHAVVDAGLKASSVDSGLPQVAERPEVRYVMANDEHGVLAFPDSVCLKLGDRIKLIPGHCDPTVNLYNELIVIQKGVVVDIWPISARGALF